MKNFLKKSIKVLLSFFGFKIVTKPKFKIVTKPRIDKFLFPLNKDNISTALYFKRMFDKIPLIEGDIVECGVGRTMTFQILAFMCEQERKGRILWGFDSFQGFPQPTKEDTSPRNPQKGEWKLLKLSQVDDVLLETGIDSSFVANQIKLVGGFFEETLPVYRNKISQIALLHLDVDLYGSYKSCLENLFPLIVPGGVVMFDEYINAEGRFPGARKAIDEYFKGTNYKIQKDEYYDRYFLIKV